MNAPTIIAAQAGYFVATLSYDDEKIELMPIIAWAMRPHYPDPDSSYIDYVDVLPVTTCRNDTHFAWLIKHPGGYFTDRNAGSHTINEKGAINYLMKMGEMTVEEHKARQKHGAMT
jgi:hypothetical protein